MLPMAALVGVVLLMGVEIPTWEGEQAVVVLPESGDAPVVVDNIATEGNEVALDNAATEGKEGAGDWGAGRVGNVGSGARVSGGDFRCPPFLDLLALFFF